MKILKDLFDTTNKLCKNDDVCLMLVFISIGIILCCLFKDRIAGYANFAPVENTGNGIQNVVQDVVQDVTQNVKEETIGIELRPKKPEPTPSTRRQLEVIAKKPPTQQGPINHKTGLLVQDSTIFKPFDEVWNPGFMPLDLVFQNVQKSVKGSMIPTSPSQGAGPAPALAGNVAAGNVAAGGEVNLVLLYAPWCGHSKKMLPDYERIKSEFHGKVMNGKKVNIMMYDSDVDKDKVKEYGVKGFPTLFVEKDGNRESFPHRSYEKISGYLNSL